MKKVLLFLSFIVVALCAKAQVTVEEPEFAEQSLILTSDSEGVLLPRESASIKTKAGASMYLTGIGKIKSRITLDGNASKVKVAQGASTRLVIRSVDNRTDPKSFINIFKFEVKKNKRQAQIGEVGTFTGSSVNSLNNIDFNAKKYGESSYLIVIDGLESGEYGVLLGDPNNVTEKNQLKVTTFAVE